MRLLCVGLWHLVGGVDNQGVTTPRNRVSDRRLGCSMPQVSKQVTSQHQLKKNQQIKYCQQKVANSFLLV